MTALDRRSVHAPHQLRRGFATLGAAAAWFAHLCVVYALVPTACRSGWGEAATVAATVAALTVAAASGVVAHRLAATADEPRREQQVDVTLGRMGVALAALFSLVVVGVAAGAAVVGPCGS